MNWKGMAKKGGAAGILLASLVGVYEGTRYVPYQDVTGIWTNCSGNTHGVDPTHTYTQEECTGINKEQEDQAFTYLHRIVTVPLSRNEAVAYADFIYNEGVGTFSNSSMFRDLEAGNRKQACLDLLKYEGVWTVDSQGKKVYKKLGGLIARRQAEYTICTTKQES